MAAETKKELFISYGREPETVNFVRLLKRDLEKNGLTIWLDAEDISAGSDWYSAIGQGLENCKGIIAVITNKYINSHYCKSELYTANNDRKHIFPIIFEDVDFSSSTTAKGVKYIISGINWTMFRPSIDDYHTSLAKLCQGMKEQGLGEAAGGGVAAVPATTSTTDALATQMGHLNVSGSGDPPPSAPPPYSYHTPPHGYPSPHGHAGGYPQSPYPYPSSAPYPSSPTTYPPRPHPPYQTTPPHPGYPHQPSLYGYAQQPPLPSSNGYPQTQGYTVPPTTQYPGMYAPPTATPPAPPAQHPGMYTPPNTTPPAPPTQHPGMYTPPNAMPPVPPQLTTYTEHTDQGPPKYSDLYKSHPPPPMPPMVPSAPPLPEKPSRASDSGSPPKPQFSVGMKLEAVDRRFPYFVCVATIMDRTDSEVLIHFDGWSNDYDYWCPPDVVELHPPGWCHRNNWELQTPRDQEWNGWDEYVSRTDSDKAPEHLFTPDQLSGPGTLLFRAGMSIEAKDRQNPSMICAATIQRIGEQGKLLIHFDGWGRNYDYWCEPSSTDIHPPMWCGKNSRKVHPPNGYQGHFKWSEYLTTPGRVPAPAHLFMKEQLSGDGRSRSTGASGGAQLGKFQVGMKLEAKDRLNPTLTAVATITDIRDKKLLIHFDGWTSKYDYWCKPTSTDIHPMGWCAKHNKDLQPPKDMSGTFSWSTYLQQNGAKAAPTNAFTSSQQ